MKGYIADEAACKSLTATTSGAPVTIVTSSSVGDVTDYPENIHLDTLDVPGEQRGGWCPDPSDSDPYIEVCK